MPSQPHLLVIGTASHDMLHLPSGVVHTIGGAGMYTALAAARAGAHVTLCAPRPQLLPAAFTAAASRITWIGPLVADEALPRLAIAHHGGGKATLLDASWGAESLLDASHLPEDLHNFDAVHIAALSSALRMLTFARTCRERSARFLSAGTYFRLVQSTPDTVRELISICDAFFMNDNEARGLFGSIEAARAPKEMMLFITCGVNGALVCTHDAHSSVSAPPAREFDPTGAGDTFCGTALTAHMRGTTPIEAATLGCAAASEMIAAAGPEMLLR